MFTSHTVTGPALDGFREYIPDKSIDLVDADELTLTRAIDGRKEI